MPTLFPELTAEGLVLWRLHRSDGLERWCMVMDFGGALTLVVHELTTDGDDPAAEVHGDFAALVRRSEVLRGELVAEGWHEVEVDPDDLV